MSDSKKKSSSRTSKRDEASSTTTVRGRYVRASLGELWSCFSSVFGGRFERLDAQFTGHSLDPLSYGATFGLLYIVTALLRTVGVFISRASSVRTGGQHRRPSTRGSCFGSTLSSACSSSAAVPRSHCVLGITVRYRQRSGALERRQLLGDLLHRTRRSDTALPVYSRDECARQFNQIHRRWSRADRARRCVFNVTGGSFNFWRSLAFQVVLNRYDTNALVAAA